MRCCIEWYVVVVLLMVLAQGVQAQPVPFHEQDRRWYAIAPDSMAQSRFYDARSVYQDGRRVLFAASEHGLLESTDDGASWQLVHMPENDIVSQVAASPTHPDTLYAITYRRIYKSTDGGEAWTDVSPQVDSTGGLELDGYPKVAVSPHDPEHVFISGGNGPVVTLASRDGGRTWIERDWPAGSRGGYVTFAVSPKTPGRVFVHAMGEGTYVVYRFAVSDDWGETFGITNYRQPWVPDLFADTSETLHTGFRVSYDLGATWEEEEGRRGFADMFEDGGFGVGVARGSSEIILYAGYDQGSRWHTIEDTLPSSANRSSATLDQRDSTVYVATSSGLDAYARPGALATPAERPDMVPAVLHLEAYPNPVRVRATVEYALPQAGPVRLAVYDLLGREVAVLVDGMQAAGRHRAQLEAGAWPAGVYLLRLEAGGRVQTSTLLLVR